MSASSSKRCHSLVSKSPARLDEKWDADYSKLTLPRVHLDADAKTALKTRSFLIPCYLEKIPCYTSGVSLFRCAGNFAVSRRICGAYWAQKVAWDGLNRQNSLFFSLLYRVYATTRKSSGEMMRKLSVIRSRKRSHFLGTVRLRKRRIADLNWAKVS